VRIDCLWRDCGGWSPTCSQLQPDFSSPSPATPDRRSTCVAVRKTQSFEDKFRAPVQSSDQPTNHGGPRHDSLCFDMVRGPEDIRKTSYANFTRTWFPRLLGFT